MIKFGKSSKENFDAMIVLGDRYEIFSAVISAGFYKVPIIHISGGETTLVIDEPIRHSIIAIFIFNTSNIQKRAFNLVKIQKIFMLLENINGKYQK